MKTPPDVASPTAECEGRQLPQRSAFDISAFITRNLHLLPVPALPEISLYTAHPASRLSRLGGTDPDAPAPFWAYGWAGGAVLARHVRDHPALVRGRRVLDLGGGSGIVAIAAARAGAASVIAADVDPNAIAAIGLNAKANAVSIDVLHADLLGGPPPPVDLILVGDLFYEDELARRTFDFLTACRAAGIDVLIGDPYRTPLPTDRLRCIAQYPVSDFGDGIGRSETRAGVFTIDPAP
jgi:predicted nicotinamide N-methyase